jgi:hypothetical protein
MSFSRARSLSLSLCHVSVAFGTLSYLCFVVAALAEQDRVLADVMNDHASKLRTDLPSAFVGK